MNYTLKKTNKFNQFYAWLYNVEITKQKTMCTYFWKYVLTILFLPLLLPLILLSKIVDKLLRKSLDNSFKNNKKSSKIDEFIHKTIDKIADNSIWNIIGKILKYTFLSVIFIILLSLVLSLIFLFYDKPAECLQFLGGLFLIILFTIGVMFLFNDTNFPKYLLKFFKAIIYPFKVIINMAYNLYKNICPVILWVD